MEHNEIEVKKNIAHQLIKAADAILQEIKSEQMATTVDFDERSLLNMFNRDRKEWSGVLLLALSPEEQANLKAFRTSSSKGQHSLPTIPLPNVWRNAERQLHRENGPAVVDDACGYKGWYLNGVRHREDGLLPAVEHHGRKEWWKNGEWQKTNWCNTEGKLHKEDGPAVEFANGTKQWWLNHKRHRENGPAFKFNDGSTEWYLYGKRHRENGPAIEYADGIREEWWQHGKRHRTDGPALDHKIGYNPWHDYALKEWWDSGKWLRTEHRNAEGQLHKEDGPAVEFANGTKKWYLNGQLHRENGPAIEFYDDTAEWYLNGLLHREEGPAVQWPTREEWYLNGKRHRTDGPALDLKICEWAFRDFAIQEWWVDGVWLRTEHRNAEGEVIKVSNGLSVECADGKAWWTNDFGLVHYQWTTD